MKPYSLILIPLITFSLANAAETSYVLKLYEGVKGPRTQIITDDEAPLKLPQSAPYAGINRQRPFPVSLGAMQPFWRNHPVLGPYLENGRGLREIPAYLFKPELCYIRRPYAKEVPFADHLSVVRFLGGTMRQDEIYEEKDLCFRNAEGKLEFRRGLVKEKLSKYLEYGYEDLTIVLDNTPWCMSADTSNAHHLGNTARPKDNAQWYALVKFAAEEIKETMGAEKAGKLRFRVGTEANGTRRFYGSEKDFEDHYDAAAAALKEVLPTAQLGAFNCSSISLSGVVLTKNVRLYELSRHCLEDKNAISGEVGTRFDFLGSSRYYGAGANIVETVANCEQAYDAIQAMHKNYLPREVQEFGGGGDWNAEPRTGEEGAYGGVLTYMMMVNFLHAGFDKIFHWEVLDDLKDKDESILLPKADAWLFTAFDHMRGGKFWILNIVNAEKNKTSFAATASLKGDTLYILAGAYNPERTLHDAFTFNAPLPQELADFIKKAKSVKLARLNQENAMHDIARKDLESAGLLDKAFMEKPEYVASVKGMGGVKGREYIKKNFAKYERLWFEACSFKEATAPMNKDGKTLRLEMRPPELVLYKISL